MYIVQSLRGRKTYTVPPDGGWGWVVMVSSFFIFGICLSILKNLGFFFNHFQDEFNTNNYQTSWISSLAYGVMGLGAPLYAVIEARIGARKLLMLSSLISSSGLVVAAFANHIYFLYIGIGIMMALGFCWAHVCALCQVGLYFKKYRSVAIGITSSGSPLLCITMPFLTNILNIKYDWRGSMLVYSGIALNICALAALVRPITYQQDDLIPINEIPSPKTERIDWRTFISRYWLLFLFAVPEFLGDLSYYIPVIYIVPYSIELGKTETQAAYLLSLTAVADLFARPLGGLLLTTYKSVENNVILYLSASVLCIALFQLIAIFNTSYQGLCLFALLYGGAFGLMVPGTLNLVPILLGSEKIHSFMGAKLFVNGISTLAGPPIAGYLVDQYGTYGIVYWYTVLVLLAASTTYFIIHILVKRGGLIRQ